MKTTIMIKNLRLSLVSLFFMMLSVNAYSQACSGNNVTITFENFTTPTASSFEFDVRISNSGTTALKLAQLGGAIFYNSGMTTAGTFSKVSDPAANDFPTLNIIQNTAHTIASRQLRWTNNPVPEASTVVLPAGVTKTFARFRYTTSTPATFPQNYAATLTPAINFANSVSNVSALVYCNGNASSTVLSNPLVAPSLSGLITIPSPYNVTLNPASGPTASVLSGSATICAGASTNLSVAVTGGTSPYTVTVTDGTNNYSATGASPVSIAVNPTSTSNYSIVSVTGGGTGTGNSGSASVTVSPLTTTGSESQSVCGASYIWPTSGQEYTASGSYTHVVGCNTATLNLTLTPATTTSESQTVCGTSYTWPTSGVSYTASGVYTFVSGCNTATLNLTLTPATTTSESQTVCGASYTWPTSGVSYTASGSYTHVVGCNTATLTLTLTPSSINTTTISASGSYTWAHNGQTYTASNTYTGTTTNCVTESLDLTITPVQSGVLSLKVYLEGYYLSGGQMRSALANSGIGTNNAISDTIKVQLRSQSSPNASVLSANVLLSTNGTASISIPPSLIGGNYYIAVYHRNSLETWSSLPIAITANTDFDFTTSSSQAYGAASMKQVETGVWALYSGDHNQDGSITSSDLGSVATEASLFSFGYINTDLTGDGAIDGFDLGLADNNSHALLVSSHP
jgi:hypothetical protein